MKRMLQISLGLSLVLVLAFSAVTAQAAWNETKKSTEQTEVLNKVTKLVETTDKPVVIFDLDSTLYKNYGRWAKIVRDYGKEKGIAKLQNFQASKVTDSWNMKRILASDAGLGDAEADKLLPDFKNFWGKTFFSNEYVAYDSALPGSIAYVNSLYKKGAAIVYITGRDEPRMKEGTWAKLKKDGFPIDVERTALMMKPLNNSELRKQAKTDQEYTDLLMKTDQEFKNSALNKAKSFGTVVASFDNDPKHITNYFRALHKAGNGVAVFLDTDHAKHAAGPVALETGIVRVNGFLK